jgi:glycosyltransferase involved in cell wall biosynthesis
MKFDCVLYQHKQNWLADREAILSAEQRRGPQIYIEHDPPRESPTNTKHIVDDPNVLLVHVTDFNALMWDNNRTPTRVIEHGVVVPEDVRYTGEIPKGCVVINNILTRGRRLGLDIYRDAAKRIPLDLVGMGWEQAGGLGEIRHNLLPHFVSQYRFFFNPIRYTSLGLAVCEAMMVGCPILGLATTEMVTAVSNGVNGYVETNLERLIGHMERLLLDRDEALHLSIGARTSALERFNIHRFLSDWNDALHDAVGHRERGKSPLHTPPEVHSCAS